MARRLTKCPYFCRHLKLRSSHHSLSCALSHRHLCSQHGNSYDCLNWLLSFDFESLPKINWNCAPGSGLKRVKTTSPEPRLITNIKHYLNRMSNNATAVSKLHQQSVKRDNAGNHGWWRFVTALICPRIRDTLATFTLTANATKSPR